MLNDKKYNIMKTLKEKISTRSNGQILGYFNHDDYPQFLSKIKKEFSYKYREFIHTRSLSRALIIKNDGLYLGGANIAGAGTGYKISDEIYTSFDQLKEFIYAFNEKHGTEFTFLNYQLKKINF